MEEASTTIAHSFRSVLRCTCMGVVCNVRTCVGVSISMAFSDLLLTRHSEQKNTSTCYYSVQVVILLIKTDHGKL
jgi:hypothetical protein